MMGRGIVRHAHTHPVGVIFIDGLQLPQEMHLEGNNGRNSQLRERGEGGTDAHWKGWIPFLSSQRPPLHPPLPAAPHRTPTG